MTMKHPPRTEGYVGAFEIKLEKDIPVRAGGRDGLWTSVFRKMEVGDSFLLPARVHSGVCNARSRHRTIDDERRFTIRRVSEEAYRCWRVK